MLSDDSIWGTIFPETDEYQFQTTIRERVFLERSICNIRSHQIYHGKLYAKGKNLLLKYLGGADGVRHVVDMLLDQMCPLDDGIPTCQRCHLRGDAVAYLVEVVQSHMITRLQSANLQAIENANIVKSLGFDAPYPVVSDRELTHVENMNSIRDGGFNCCNGMSHHNCTRGYLCSRQDWTWPAHDCVSDEILSFDNRRKLVRALAYRAGIPKLDGTAFSTIATEVLHHLAVIVSHTYNLLHDRIPEVANSRDVEDLRMNSGLSHYANCVIDNGEIIPRLIKDAAVMMGMQPLRGFGSFGAEWAASNRFSKEQEVEDALSLYDIEDESCSKNPPSRWRCDFCDLEFDDYDVAAEHELGCSKNPDIKSDEDSQCFSIYSDESESQLSESDSDESESLSESDMSVVGRA